MIGQPYNPDNCAFVTNQALNTNQFNGNVPYSSNNTTHLVLWDFVDNKLLWVNSQNNVIESEIGGSNLPTNVGNLVINEDSEPQSTLVREYYNGFFVKNPLSVVTNTTQEIIGAILFVPANTFKVGDYFGYIARLTYVYNTNTASNDSFVNIWYNSLPNLSGSNLISSMSISKSDANLQEEFIYGLKQGRKITSINGYTGGVESSLPFSYIDNDAPMFDVTQDNYLIVSFIPQDVGCAFAVTDFYLNKVLNGQLITP